MTIIIYNNLIIRQVVFEIKFNTFLSILGSKITHFISKTFFKGGSNFPGRVALKLDKNVLKTVSKNYKIILVTGTNGKTTTTSMIYNILKNAGHDVITNSTGANMHPGIVSCFITNYKLFKKTNQRYAVIEVDEANLKFITSDLSPEIITITNLFRDQLDRYGEVYTTLNIILKGIVKSPNAKLILNGDESLLGHLDIPNERVYYGFKNSIDRENIDVNTDAKFCKVCGSPYEYNFITYNHLGDFKCSKCDYKRPELKYSVDKLLDLTPSSSTAIINNEEYTINQGGIYNIYNALCAYSITKELGIDSSIIGNSFKNQESHFGRQEVINIDGKQVKILLVKNPAGYNQAIDTVSLDTKDMSVAFLLNDNYADSRDVSWIWDINFENLKTLQINDIFVSGIRLYDMAVRLKIAGFDPNKFIINKDFEALLQSIKNCNDDNIYVFATYTAMTSFRKFLHGKKYIDKLW